MNKLNNTLSTKEHYNAPKCEMHEIVPEGTICMPESSQEYQEGGAGNYDDATNTLGGWF